MYKRLCGLLVILLLAGSVAYYNYSNREDLYDAILQVKPKVHVFGHIHEAYGEESTNGVQFINASVLNLQYQLVNLPVTITV